MPELMAQKDKTSQNDERIKLIMPKQKILIIAGHGGIDSGAVGVSTDGNGGKTTISEARANLNVARYLFEMLRNAEIIAENMITPLFFIVILPFRTLRDVLSFCAINSGTKGQNSRLKIYFQTYSPNAHRFLPIICRK